VLAFSGLLVGMVPVRTRSTCFLEPPKSVALGARCEHCRYTRLGAVARRELSWPPIAWHSPASQLPIPQSAVRLDPPSYLMSPLNLETWVVEQSAEIGYDGRGMFIGSKQLKNRLVKQNPTRALEIRQIVNK
jgi:hypothetical protein